MNKSLASRQNLSSSWEPRAEPMVVGKDILDLLSSSMYIDPMTVYREYVQNAADAIDEALSKGLLPDKRSGRVDITIDDDTRTVCIRDNGSGIGPEQFEERLTAFGASMKRGTRARGFRGVGRLAGLGYCQELVFRSRASGDSNVNEMRWNCKKIKSTLRSAEINSTLQDVVNSSVEIRRIDGRGWPEHFFEVELRGIVRHKNDALLSSTVIRDYLSQVAPVPFCPDFKFGDAISAALSEHIALGNLNLSVGGVQDQVYRPHRNKIEVGGAVYDKFTDVEIFSIPSVDGGLGAVAWILHHGYKGAMPISLLRGLRLRSGNIQVGERDVLQEIYTEPRFNSWTVGEIHTIDSRIIPNGRRDYYEQNVHFNNLINQVAPIARKISTCCRQSSVLRNLLREFQAREDKAKEKLQAIKQGGLGSSDRKKMVNSVDELVRDMRRLAGRESLAKETRDFLTDATNRIAQSLTRARQNDKTPQALSSLTPNKRRTYEQVFALIYECSSSHANAHSLVERILGKLTT